MVPGLVNSNRAATVGERTQAILLVAAEPREFSGLLRHCRNVRPLPWPIDYARSATLRGREVVLAANGAGSRRAASCVDAAFQNGGAAAVASIGFCGALDPDLKLAQVVTDNVATIDRVATTVAEKAHLRATGASAVEMEAAGVAERARAYGVPFHCIKAVTDLAGENLSIDYNSALRPDGHFDTIYILRSAISRPSERMPELYRIWRRTSVAARALGEFLARYGF